MKLFYEKFWESKDPIGQCPYFKMLFNRCDVSYVNNANDADVVIQSCLDRINCIPIRLMFTIQENQEQPT